MFTKIQKRTIIYVVMFLSALLTFATLTTNTYKIAQAQTFEQRIPNYGLYCADSEIIKNGRALFDLTDTELLSQGKGITKYEYEVVAKNGAVEFSIPFLSKARELPQIAVTVNGEAIEGSVWFGDEAFWMDNEFDIDNTYSPVLDESIMGTLYTVIPDNETITISLSYTESKSFIYETSNHLSSTHSASGSHTWTLHNALSKPSYYFFVFGDDAENTFNSSCEYKAETMTCKEFIDNQYQMFTDYYDYNGGVPIEIFYSLVNKVLQSNLSIRYDELFFNSIDSMRLNAYKFSVTMDADSVIRYELPVSVQRNYAFKPLIYLVEQKQTGDYVTSYTIELGSDNPYIIESSIKTESKGLSFTAETAEDFYFVFSSSEKPTNTATSNNGIN
ncbi:MAG: hypothetical protein NC310_05890, partial [Roseburia sp.]|nr:hypothetical protein [Roseburia sp.]MCM1557097.1 hypothetical protein [Anaeroplasma bactoclasticum]